jgi:coatomer subunit beta'
MYVLGYLPRDGRVYVCDKDVNVSSYALSLSVVEYQTLVLRGELETANEMLPDIPEEQKNKIARFLEGQGYKEEALEVATDPEHRFDLSLGLGKLDVALELARSADAEHKWKTVGDAALTAWDIALAQRCFEHAKDLGSLLLLYSSTCNVDGLRELAKQAEDAASNNVAFACLWQLGDVDGCIDTLVRTNRVGEAVLFSQTYKPSRTPKLVKLWKEALEKDGKAKVSRMLGVPPSDENEGDAEMFPHWDEWLELEKNGPSESDSGHGTGKASEDDEGDEEQAEAEAEADDDVE